MRILLTGAASFTGLWFVRALAEAGHEVWAPLRRERSVYPRAELLAPHCELIDNAPFGSDRFLQLMRSEGSFDLLCHHAAEVKNYRSPDFNVEQAVKSNTHNLRSVLDLLGDGQVVLTGTVFEPDVTPYGVSKGITTQIFRNHCSNLRHFVIPNPFGPHEEPRFSAYLMREWAAGRTAEVRTPDYIRDNIHVRLLAKAYVDGIDSPSGYVETMGEFTARYAREMRVRLGWECRFICLEQTDFSDPLELVNSDPVSHETESQCWDDLAEYYFQSLSTATGCQL